MNDEQERLCQAVREVVLEDGFETKSGLLEWSGLARLDNPRGMFVCCVDDPRSAVSVAASFTVKEINGCENAAALLSFVRSRMRASVLRLDELLRERLDEHPISASPE